MPDMAAPPEPPPPPAPRLPFQLPAEYYASPERRPPALPRAVPFGCGTAAIVFLIVFFVPVSYYTDAMAYRMYRKRLERSNTPKTR